MGKHIGILIALILVLFSTNNFVLANGNIHNNNRNDRHENRNRYDHNEDDDDDDECEKTPSPRPTASPRPTVAPTATPSATPSATPVPAITPDPNDMCTNIDGVQLIIPEGWFQISPDSTFCRQFQYGGPQVSDGQASEPQGQVLGASTMAGTGGFAETFYQAIMGVGALLTLKGVKKLKK